MIRVTKVTNCGGACPFQVEGVTDLDEPVYARYRSGHLTVQVNSMTVFDEQLGKDQDDEKVLANYRKYMPPDMVEKMEISFKNMREAFPDSIICFDGSMTYDELRAVTAGMIEWPNEGVTDNQPEF